MSDKYERALAFFKKHPDAVRYAWNAPRSHPHGCLFQWASRTGGPKELVKGQVFCGCLTMIRKNHQCEVEGRPDLTQRIREDKRIPKGMSSIRVKDLEAFAEWQRLLDREVRHLAPVEERSTVNGRV